MYAGLTRHTVFVLFRKNILQVTMPGKESYHPIYGSCPASESGMSTDCFRWKIRDGGDKHVRKEDIEYGRDEGNIRRTERIQLLRKTAVLQLRVRRFHLPWMEREAKRKLHGRI